MPEYLSPGIYIEEFDSGPVPIGGVGTSTAGFIGLAQRGVTEGLPELVTSYADFQRQFGGYLSEKVFGVNRFLAYSVEQFFMNGGSRCYVMRVVPEDAKKAKKEIGDKIEIEAVNSGAWGDRITVVVKPSFKGKSPIVEDVSADGKGKYKFKTTAGFNEGDIITLTQDDAKQVRKIEFVQDGYVTINEPFTGDVIDTNIVPKILIYTSEVSVQVSYGDEVEEYENVGLNTNATNFVTTAASRSNLVSISIAEGIDDEIVEPFVTLGGEGDKLVLNLSSGSDGSMDKVTPDTFTGADLGPGKRTGIMSFIDNDEVAIMAVPGITDPAVQVALVGHCENTTSRFAILDIEKDVKKVNDVKQARSLFDSTYAAVYHPWLKINDPLEKKTVSVPPSGAMLGIYGRTDNTRGVHKAPANEIVRGCIGLDCQYNKGEQDILNPIGVNLIRFFPGQGIRVWGARTLSSNALWRYINVRRLFIFLEQSVKVSTNWVVFEPNDENLWGRVRRSLYNFLEGVWRTGALVGSTPDEAFFVKVDRTTMTQDDIDNGRLICIIGVAPVKPAEFVIFKFTQKTAGGED